MVAARVIVSLLQQFSLFSNVAAVLLQSSSLLCTEGGRFYGPFLATNPPPSSSLALVCCWCESRLLLPHSFRLFCTESTDQQR